MPTGRAGTGGKAAISALQLQRQRRPPCKRQARQLNKALSLTRSAMICVPHISPGSLRHQVQNWPSARAHRCPAAQTRWRARGRCAPGHPLSVPLPSRRIATTWAPRGKTVVTPVRQSSPCTTVASPTSSPATSTMQLLGPGRPSKDSPTPRARMLPHRFFWRVRSTRMSQGTRVPCCSPCTVALAPFGAGGKDSSTPSPASGPEARHPLQTRVAWVLSARRPCGCRSFPGCSGLRQHVVARVSNPTQARADRRNKVPLAAAA